MRLAGTLGVLAVLLLALWVRSGKLESKQPAQTEVSPEAASAATQMRRTPHLATNIVPAEMSSRGLQESFGSLLAAGDAKSARQQLAELRAAFSAMPKSSAVAAIRQSLDSKVDSGTKLGFKVARTGWLDDAPTMRTFLLDELGRLDPTAAAEYAKSILSSADSADEWAVALRNLARGDMSSAGRSLLEQKMGEMLRNEAWQQNPSVGYLEAFDAAVYLGGTNLMPVLTELVRKQDNPAVAHAAYLALDRLVINDTATALSALEADITLMQGREQTRANYFARADVRDPQQRQVLEKYLLDPQIGPAELNTFAGIYPNANFMISQNLLTPTPTPDHTALLNRDAESLRVLDEWLADPRFVKVRPDLGKAKMRLEEFVRQVNSR
jgi:hypothetical protein